MPEIPDQLDRVPGSVAEPVVGLLVLASGVLGVIVGGGVVAVAGSSLFATTSSGLEFRSPVVFLGIFLLLAVVFIGIGGGVTYAYLAYRQFEPGFVVDWPDRATAPMLAGLGVLAPLLVGVASLLETYVATPGSEDWLTIPAGTTFSPLIPPALFPGPQYEGWGFLVNAGFNIVLITGGFAPALALLYHGVLQTTLRRIWSGPLAVGGTAVVLVATMVSFGGGWAAVFLGGFAAAVGSVYERTENLAIPIGAYAVYHAVTLTAAVAIVQSAA